ncbi:hypothetical protein [Paludisphaera rhizosphaerae]|uniref:hypothetical protein n=1 Tax=Paludisphaera rhizosphaerae TaxID=2711216 RepID=UPI0013EBA0CF|nr:hypothetical protein [Paludisphaera rhizosphaerae]
MRGLSRAGLGLSLLAVILGANAVNAQQHAAPPTPLAASDLTFLEVGNSYMIQFAPGADPFVIKSAELSRVSTTTTDAGGKTTTELTPSTLTMTYRVPEFVVKKLGGGSWALLEYPLDVKAAAERMLARLALKNTETMAEQEKTEEGRMRIAEWKTEADRQIPTAEAWINLAHAVVIAPPLADPRDPRIQTPTISVEIK